MLSPKEGRGVSGEVGAVTADLVEVEESVVSVWTIGFRGFPLVDLWAVVFGGRGFGIVEEGAGVMLGSTSVGSISSSETLMGMLLVFMEDDWVS